MKKKIKMEIEIETDRKKYCSLNCSFLGIGYCYFFKKRLEIFYPSKEKRLIRRFPFFYYRCHECIAVEKEERKGGINDYIKHYCNSN